MFKWFKETKRSVFHDVNITYNSSFNVQKQLCWSTATSVRVCGLRRSRGRACRAHKAENIFCLA